jgi:choline dehydrogenase-like flavoprotein
VTVSVDMRFLSLREIDDAPPLEADLCIVGTGPAGLSLLHGLKDTRLRILLVESGGLSEPAEEDLLNDMESVGAPRVMDQSVLRSRGFGGSSRIWRGRCAPLDHCDYEERAWVPGSGWPVGAAQIAPFFPRAAELLGIAPQVPTAEEDIPAQLQGLAAGLSRERLLPACWQYSRHSPTSHDYMRFGPHFRNLPARNVTVLLHATALHLDTDESGRRIEGIEVGDLSGRRHAIRAGAVVLCAGGLENPRLMLASRRRRPEGVGNSRGLVGRYMMDHPRFRVAEFPAAAARRLRRRFGLHRVRHARGATNFIHGLRLSPVLQAREGLLNCAAWLGEYRAEDNPWDAMRRLAAGKSPSALRDLATILRQPGLVTEGAFDHFVRRRGIPHKVDRLILDAAAEQVPDPESRLLLSDRVDVLGMPLARIDWRVSPLEIRSIRRLGEVIAEEFRAAGLPEPQLERWIRDGDDQAARFEDHAHPIGATRMATSPDRGVVDTNCEVHGVRGLYVAGSSVFPTTGHANPTLMIVALTLRLAAHLRGALDSR